MKIEIEKISEKFGKKLLFNEKLSKYSWFNLGGPAKIFFKPDTLEQIKIFLKEVKDSYKITCLGAGSNTLIRDGGFNGAVIKLSPKFSFVKLEKEEIIETGAATLDKTLSSFALENSISGFEFLSCIPGSIGGAIIMNSGCYGDEISSILHSVKTIDYQGVEKEFKRGEIQLFYRGTNLPKDLIIISAKFKGKPDIKDEIEKRQIKMVEKKKLSQPNQIKTCGSTFKNLDKQKKAWMLIKEAGCNELAVGDAVISKNTAIFLLITVRLDQLI